MALFFWPVEREPCRHRVRLPGWLGSTRNGPITEVSTMGMRALSRRDFLRISGGAGVGLFLVGQVGGQLFEIPVAAAQTRAGRSIPVG
jgi:hypothetical protein